MNKIYKYDGQKFEVSEPKGCEITVSGKGHSGTIYAKQSTGTFATTFYNVWKPHATVEEALKFLCQKILDREKNPPLEELCKEMESFYDKLD